MHESSLTAVGQPDQETKTPVEIGRGYHGTIELDPGSGVVCKQFRIEDTGEAADLARREFDCLRRFSAALAGQPFLHCPAAVRVDPEQGKVWMTYCPGTELDRILSTSSASIDADLEHIAEQLAIALETYIAEFNEPYYDLATKHVLYDMPTRKLNLIDFTSRRRNRQSGSKHAPFETSLGIFIGFSTYDSVGRQMWRNRDYWRCQERLSVALLAQLSARHNLSRSLILQVGRDVYSHGGSSGRPLRRLWYRTIGQMLFTRRTNAIMSRAAANIG